ncbi:hypothetical protein QE385_003416 [Sphingomonas sp. SORGH_AS 950]|uniref:hypothetical protein n=1 Tax=Sphingomonas sp. SORGH_AS_0950 TaxID=3041792 RepID=UPI0027898805|nr:hypothetical protein [Sphingomonas sp. SORGH_AS_0950]MDQ1159089.1 hypothetical protein [Sphingomonas sp. SORGH_AS_0950]
MDSPFFFEGTKYRSRGDEASHFHWMERIACIRRVKGIGRRVFMDIDRSNVTATALEELNAIYHRYGGDLTQLTALSEGGHAQD